MSSAGRYFLALAAVFMLAACTSTIPMRPAFQLAQERMQQGDWTGARRLLEKEIRQHPQHQDARYNLALLLERNDHRDDAAELYRQNLRLAPHLASAINLAAYYRDTNQPEQARQVLQQAAHAFPHEAIPWYMLGLLEQQQKQHQQRAEQAFLTALQADHSNGFAHLYYARFLAVQGNMDSALTHGRRAVTLLPECATCWRIYSEILAAAKQLSQAIAACQRSLAIEPDTTAREQLIELLEQAGDHERARQMKQALTAWKRQHADISPAGLQP